jgi:glyoxylase-like metal-dependent hydrolase (beta-lactamase superfamily II)
MSHRFEQASPRVFWLTPESTTDRPVLGVVAGAAGSLVVDAGNSPAHAHTLFAAMAAAGLPPVRYLVLTHWHWDHWFGISAFDVPIIAHVATQRILAAQATWDWSDAALDARVAQGIEIAFCRDMLKAELPDRRDLRLRAPDIAFTGAMEIDLGGITCRLIHVGGDHAADSIVVHIPEERIAFLSDCRYEDLYVTPRRYTTGKLFPLLDRLLELDVECYFGGHEPAPIPRAELTAEAVRLRLVGETVARMGADRVAVLAALAQELGQPPDEDTLAFADAFLAGL